MSDKEKIIEELKKQIKLVKKEIIDKELVLNHLMEQLEEIDN
mgnify:FL=1